MDDHKQEPGRLCGGLMSALFSLLFMDDHI